MDDFLVPFVARRAASEAAVDYRTSLGNSEAAAQEQPTHESPVEE